MIKLMICLVGSLADGSHFITVRCGRRFSVVKLIPVMWPDQIQSRKRLSILSCAQETILGASEVAKVRLVKFSPLRNSGKEGWMDECRGDQNSRRFMLNDQQSLL